MQRKPRVPALLAPVVALCLLLASCALAAPSSTSSAPQLPAPAGLGQGSPSAAPTGQTSGAASAVAGAVQGTTPGAGAAAVSTPSGSAAALAQNGVLSLVTVPDGTSASYKVREQLAGHNFPNDAIGTTTGVTGTLAIRPDGTLLPGSSRFVVDLQALKSDQPMRDGYLRRATLQTSTYPDMVFVPTAVAGLPSPLPASGDLAFQIAGDCTLKGVTHHVTWNATAHVADQQLTGSASTTQTFESLGLTQPHVMRVLTIQDSIQLQINFHMVLAPSAA